VKRLIGHYTLLHMLYMSIVIHAVMLLHELNADLSITLASGIEKTHFALENFSARAATIDLLLMYHCALYLASHV